MTLSGRFLATFTLLVAFGACDSRDARQSPRQPPTRAATRPASLDDRLLGTLDGRRQWPSNAVKIWLKNPTVSLEMRSSDNRPVRVQAWAHNQNDYNTAMMRLNEGDVLYAITNAEFEELRTRAAGERAP